MLFMWLFGLLFLMGVALAIAWLVRQGGPSSGQSRRPGVEDEEPLKILERRYARGEISGDEYARMKRELA